MFNRWQKVLLICPQRQHWYCPARKSITRLQKRQFDFMSTCLYYFKNNLMWAEESRICKKERPGFAIRTLWFLVLLNILGQGWGTSFLVFSPFTGSFTLPKTEKSGMWFGCWCFSEYNIHSVLLNMPLTPFSLLLQQTNQTPGVLPLPPPQVCRK